MDVLQNLLCLMGLCCFFYHFFYDFRIVLFILLIERQILYKLRCFLTCTPLILAGVVFEQLFYSAAYAGLNFIL